jgi:lipopolysaccharide transport system ATP-binding protein
MSSTIKAENISKAYQLGDFGTGTISRDLERFFARIRGKEDPFLKIGQVNDRTTKGTSDVVWSLKDINFEIEKGDAVGIIGRNGAGKSTLLKILSRVTSPTSGSIKVKGRIASLLEVGTGFHPELTGKENIYLNGAILGMRKSEIKRKFDEIVDFSGVERYIDTPVKRYSSGMYVRLAFAVAAHLESEILIVDEVLAVGDAEFQKKCLGKMDDISRGEGRTILFVSHNMDAVSKLTKSSIFLHDGGIIKIGLTPSIISTYLSFGASGDLIYVADKNQHRPTITSIQVITSQAGNTHVNGDKLEIVAEVFLPIPLKNGAFAIQLFNSAEVPVVHFWILDSEKEIFKKTGLNRIKCIIPNCKLFLGTYSINAYLSDSNGINLLQTVERVCPFKVEMFKTVRDHPWEEGSSTYLEDFEWEIE